MGSQIPFIGGIYNIFKNQESTISYPLGWLSKTQKTSVGQDVDKMEPSCTIYGTVKWDSCYGKQYGCSSKNLNYQII